MVIKMSLHVYCGPMFSSKSFRMLMEANKLIDVNNYFNSNKALIINHELNKRDLINHISSHSSLYKGLSDNMDVVYATILSTVNVDNYHIICIDEINFFEDCEDLVTTIKKWINANKHIICAGLDSDSNMNKFGYISELVHLSDTFVKLNAICTYCSKEIIDRAETITPCNSVPAPFTKRLKEGNSIIEVGGTDLYVAVCRRHHNKYS
jgi:thymidine kinase